MNTTTEHIAVADEAVAAGSRSAGSSNPKSIVTVIGIVGAVLIILVGGYVWYSAMQTSKNDEANVALGRVREFYNNGEYDKALTGEGLPKIDGVVAPGLREIADTYGSTPAGQTACLMVGSVLVNRGETVEARGYFERATSSNSVEVRSAALAGIAACAEHDGQFAEAASKYEEAAQVADRTGLEDRHWLHAGLTYERAGNKDKAISAFTVVVKKFGQSETAAQANLGLARLGTAID
jgi:tetratricopeptide (TPR) repeat protein